jgi:hypothetical protein
MKFRHVAAASATLALLAAGSARADALSVGLSFKTLTKILTKSTNFETIKYEEICSDYSLNFFTTSNA